MKSFPSTLNESESMYSSGKAASYSSTFDIERIKALNLNTSLPVIKEQLQERNINIGNFQRYPSQHAIYHNGFEDNSKDDNSPKIFYENPLELPASAIALAKDYDWIYKYQVNSLISVEKDGWKATASTIVPSMFNPMYGVSALGLIRNTPLLNDYNIDNYDKNIDDCSIRTLCTLSKEPNSPIGHHRYKYADFMYCKDLGKVSNNYMITLRKFAHPVSDHIGRGTIPQNLGDGGEWSWEMEGDVGRLITWFGTDDNKLEDIAKFSYDSTWKKLEAEIQQEDSKAEDPNTGILGMLSNATSAQYNSMAGSTAGAGSHSVLTWLGSQLLSPENATRSIGSNNYVLYRNYDTYKVYTPRNTVQENHIYEGKIEFSHEFTLKFTYELKAYDNINPRSAFLDLIGNILEVTHRRGKFWGGDRKIVGPSQDTSMFNKVHKFIDGAVDEIPGFLSSMAAGGQSIGKIMSSIVGGAKDLLEGAMEAGKNIVNAFKEPSDTMQTIGAYFSNMNDKYKITEAIKGMLKNAVGRPQLYAWHSLVKGDDVGLWHVTVGNPRNPILSIGNLILTNSEIKQYGPLGVDDFPTFLTVTVTLKHPRPRDITDIGRMYTGGTNALYHVLSGHETNDFFSSKKGTYQNIDKIEYSDPNDLEENAKKAEEADKQGIKHGQNQRAAKRREELNAEHQMAANYKFNGMTMTSNGLPDPSLNKPMDVCMMRKNTWSDIMFKTMIQETA